MPIKARRKCHRYRKLYFSGRAERKKQDSAAASATPVTTGDPESTATIDGSCNLLAVGDPHCRALRVPRQRTKHFEEPRNFHERLWYMI